MFRIWLCSLLMGLALGVAAVASGYPAPPPEPSLPPSVVPPAIQQLRRAMLDPEMNALTFRSMDRLFTTRTVARSGPVWQLPRSDRPLDFTYRFDGVEYTPADFLERSYTNALLIIRDGRILAEIYRNHTDAQTRFIAWSATKSLVSILVGCALQEALIASLDDPVTQYLPELSGGGYDGVTIRQLLQMRSGVDYEERYDFGNPGVAARNHELALVTNQIRFVDAARTIRRKHPPGAVWEYKTLDTAVLGWLLERVSHGSNLAAFAAQRLWEPLGAEQDAFFIMDGPPGEGREFSGAGFNATLRDLGRVGLMMLNEGMAGTGRRIVSADWVHESTRPTGGPGPGYGYQWWTVPDSRAYEAIGLQGQYLHVDPETRTVVVKLSYFPPGRSPAEEETAAFFAAVARWPTQ